MKTLPVRKFPSTMALQCFEASARHMSFTKAAEELHMTQSAVSKQVAHLETLLTQKLFIRTSQYLQITPIGKQYLSEVVSVLQQVENATMSILSYDKTIEELKIAGHPTLCSRWLTPLLFGFGKTHPNIRLDIRDQINPDLKQDREPFDIAFLLGDGLWPGMNAIKLFNEENIVVCSPVMSRTLNQVLDLTSYTFLQVRSRPRYWQQYFSSQGVEVSECFTGPKFDTFYACISAAESGCGLALVPKCFVQKELEEGKLICPWDYIFLGEMSYYMLYPTAASESPKVCALIDWIKDKAS